MLDGEAANLLQEFVERLAAGGLDQELIAVFVLQAGTGASAGPMMRSFSGGGLRRKPRSVLMRIAISFFSLRTRTLAMALNGG